MADFNIVENLDIDLNSLFNLTYNFDLLKQTLEKILKNQKNHSNHIKDLNEKIAEKDKKINEIENKLGELEIMNIKIKSIEINVNEQVVPDLSEIKKKISDHDNSLEQHNEKIDIHTTEIDDLKKKFEHLNSKYEELSELTNQINIKIMDFNIFDAIKNKKSSEGDGTGGGNFDEILVIIENLKKNVFAKFDKVDEEQKTIKDEQNKTKSEIFQMKNEIEKTNKLTSTHSKQIQELYLLIEELKKEIKDHDEKVDKHLKEQIGKMQEYINSKLREIILLINNKGNPDSSVPISQFSGLDNADLEMLRDDNKRINELEKQMKEVLIKVNFEFPDTFKKIFLMLDLKSNLEDLEQSKQKIINNFEFQISTFKEAIDQINSDLKDLHEITIIKRKIENIMQILGNLKPSNNDESDVKVIKPIMPNENKYVEISIYNEFLRTNKLQIDHINARIDELRKLIDEILLELKNKVNEKELKNLEEFLLSKFEELRIGCMKKFADRNETAKNIKYLDTLIKQIEINLRKIDKGENWLIAKKPIDGFACASCEAYIGQLQDNNQYIPWNKYPMRDPNEKLYRVGNGFSRMLQMLNLDNVPSKVKEVQYQTSSNFYHHKEKDILKDNQNINSEDLINKKEINFSKSKNNFHNKIETNLSIEKMEGEEKNDTPNAPKM